MNILQHDVFSSIILFPINDDKKNQRRRRTKGWNEANAKVRKAEEFPGVSRAYTLLATALLFYRIGRER